MTTHYFIQVGDGKPFGVTKHDFVQAERGAGFHPKRGKKKDEPCTTGFSANNIKGTIREVPQFFTPTVEEIDGIPADSNPFNYDSWSMGSDLVRGWMAMHSGFDNAADPQPLHNPIGVRNSKRFAAFFALHGFEECAFLKSGVLIRRPRIVSQGTYETKSA